MAIIGGLIFGLGLAGLAVSIIESVGVGGSAPAEPILIAGLGFGLGAGMMLASTYRN
jgi:hypothetical protein